MLRSFYHEHLIEAGCDEAGRGCLAGPVFAAAVILPKSFTHPLLNDSKQLSAATRAALRVDIEAAALAFAVAEVSHETIDRINILKASFKAMHLAIDTLPLRPEILLIDGNRFAPYLGIPHQCIVKGDSKYFSIAAASILAKTYRDDCMLALDADYPQYGWAANKGYGTAQHLKALIEYGASPWHRQSFNWKKSLIEKGLLKP